MLLLYTSTYINVVLCSISINIDRSHGGAGGGKRGRSSFSFSLFGGLLLHLSSYREFFSPRGWPSLFSWRVFLGFAPHLVPS